MSKHDETPKPSFSEGICASFSLFNRRSMWVGESEKLMKEVCDILRNLPPVILQCDEADSGREMTRQTCHIWAKQFETGAALAQRIVELFGLGWSGVVVQLGESYMGCEPFATFGRRIAATIPPEFKRAGRESEMLDWDEIAATLGSPLVADLTFNGPATGKPKPTKLEWDQVANMGLDEVRRRLTEDFKVKPEQMEGKSKLELKDMLCVLSDKATGHAKRPEKVRVHIGTKADFLKAGRVEHGTCCYLKFIECGREIVDPRAHFYGPSRDGISQEVNGLVFSANGYQKQLFWSDIEECWFVKE